MAGDLGGIPKADASRAGKASGTDTVKISLNQPGGRERLMASIAILAQAGDSKSVLDIVSQLLSNKQQINLPGDAKIKTAVDKIRKSDPAKADQLNADLNKAKGSAKADALFSTRHSPEPSTKVDYFDTWDEPEKKPPVKDKVDYFDTWDGPDKKPGPDPKPFSTRR